MLILQRPWTQQPEQSLRLRGKWLGRVVQCAVGGNKADVANGKFETVTRHTMGVRPTLAGVADLPNTSAGGTQAYHPGGDKWAQVVVLIPSSVTGNQQICACDNSTLSERFFQFRTSGSTLEFIRFNTAISSFSASLSSAVSIGIPSTIVASTSGANIRIRIGGRVGAGTITGTPSVWATDTNSNWWYRQSAGAGNEPSLNPTALRVTIVGDITLDEEIALANNPWQELFDPRKIYIPVSVAGGDVTLALTGASTTLSAGTLGVSVAGTQALTGASSTLSPGTVTASVSTSVALSGAASTLSPGTVAASITVTLTGAAITAAPGTVSAGADVTVNLSGSSTTLSPGSVGLSVAATRALTGIASTVSAGTLTAGGDVAVALTGTAVTVSPGTITAGADASVALTGTATTLSPGSVGFTVAGTQALTSASTTLSPGTITATTATTVAITGISSTVSAGTVTPVTGTAVALTGSQAILSAGTVGISVAATQALTGASSTVSAGTLVQSQPDVTIALTGAALVIAQGNIFLRGVWVPVVDTQTATWVPVVDTNTATWTQI